MPPLHGASPRRVLEYREDMSAQEGGRAVSRRRFLRGLGAAGAGLVLAACTPSVWDPPAPASPSVPPAAPTPEPTLPPEEPTAVGIDPDEVAARFADATPSAWGLDMAGIITHQESAGIVLTLDACGGPRGSGYDRALIDGLIEREVPAVLFLNQRWIGANPETARALAANPLFEIANHGTQHKPLSVTGASAYGIAGTGSAAEAVVEVWGNHQAIAELTGAPPRFFRSGTAHYDDVAVEIVTALGEQVVGFAVNADAGATFGAETVRAQVAGAAPGSILIAHMNQPSSGTAAGILAGVDDQLARGESFNLLD